MWPTEGVRDKASEGWSSLDRRGRALAVVGLGVLLVALVATTWLSIVHGRGAGPVIYGQSASQATLWLWSGTAYRSKSITTGPRSNQADMTWDPGIGVLLLWDHGCGRLVMGFTGGCVDQVNQTWTWDGAAWTAHSPRSSPAAIGTGAAFYDGRLGRAVYVNGAGQVWSWTGSDWTAVALPGAPPIPVPGSATAPAMFAAGFDDDRQLLVFALTTSTWTWDGSSWSKHLGGVPAGEVGSSRHLVYDHATGQLVYVGSHKTWSWDGEVWTPSEQPNLPSESVAYDPDMKAVVAVAQDTSSCNASACRTITYFWDSKSWQRLSVDDSPLFPITRSGATVPPVTFDPAVDALVLFVSAV